MTASHPKRTPKLRHHKATGQALVELDGRRIYLVVPEKAVYAAAR